MNATIACPGCDADLLLPTLPPGQTVQCPRCQHVFEPAHRQPVSPVQAPKSRPVDAFPDQPLEPFSPPRFRPLAGVWTAIFATIMLSASVLSYGFQLYLAYEKGQLDSKLDQGEFRNRKRPIFRRAIIPMDAREAEIERQRTYVNTLRPYADFAHFITFWPALFVFLIWLYQASANLRILQAAGVVYSPTKAVFSFFIPIANFFLPYLVVQEIWRASNPSAVKDVRSWQQTPRSWLVLIWWIAFMAAMFLRVFASMASSHDDFGNSREPIALSGGSNVWMMLAGATLAVVIYHTSKNQRARHAKIYDEAR
jgi:Domain of unknown function (DUF4328)